MTMQMGNGSSVGPGGPGLDPGTAGDGAKRPIGEVIASVVAGFRTLARQHVELAKLESTEAASVRAQGAGMMAAAAALGLFALGFVAAAGSAALALVLPTWAANLIVGGVFVIATVVLLLVGRAAMRKAPNVDETRETVKEDVRWAKRQLAR
jgi:hypothetical protein